MTLGELTLYFLNKNKMCHPPPPLLPLSSLPLFHVVNSWKSYTTVSPAHRSRDKTTSLWYRICNFSQDFLLQKVQKHQIWGDSQSLKDPQILFLGKSIFLFLASQLQFCNTLNIFSSDVYILPMIIYTFHSCHSNMCQV